MSLLSTVRRGNVQVLMVLAALGLMAGLASPGCDGDDDDTAGAAGGTSLLDAGSISGLALINPTCGVGDGGTVSGDCVDCAQDHCADDFAQCFGTSWQTDLHGGICTDFGGCVMACDCGDSDCFNTCMQAVDADPTDPCRECLVELVACEQAHCAELCDDDPNTNPDGGHAGDGGPGSG